jgi:hypothetical protein
MNWSRLGLSKQRGGPGFRDLEAFNLALLAKQGWRLIQQPNSLLAQVLKGKYFPKDSFLQAKLGVNPSFTWRSLINARSLLEKGLMWRIGNGQQVRIWGDKWLPSSTDHRVHSTVQLLSHDAKVAELLDPETGWWNYNLINALFSPTEAAKVCSVVPSPMSQEDKLVWPGSKNGCFTVRSAYHLEMDTRVQVTGEASNSGKIQHFWKIMWSWKFPPMLKNF